MTRSPYSSSSLSDWMFILPPLDVVLLLSLMPDSGLVLLLDALLTADFAAADLADPVRDTPSDLPDLLDWGGGEVARRGLRIRAASRAVMASFII